MISGGGAGRRDEYKFLRHSLRAVLNAQLKQKN